MGNRAGKLRGICGNQRLVLSEISAGVDAICRRKPGHKKKHREVITGDGFTGTTPWKVKVTWTSETS